MLAWRGEGHPPNYLQRAWHTASPSLRKMVERLPEERAEELVFQAYMTSGTRAILSADAVIAWAERRLNG
jgi:hypothetical protein